MKFCKKCKGIMKPLDENRFECVSCGFSDKDKDLVETESILLKEKKKEGFVEDKNNFADYDFICSKCGFNKAEVVERQPYVSDEDSLTYLRCGKCGWMENLAKKTS